MGYVDGPGWRLYWAKREANRAASGERIKGKANSLSGGTVNIFGQSLMPNLIMYLDATYLHTHKSSV